MPIYLDTPAGAEADIVQGNTRVSRGFIATKIDTTSPAEAMLMAMVGLPGRGSLLSSRFPWPLKRYAVRALRGRVLTGRLIYEEPLLGQPEETFFAEDVTTLSTGTTQLMPGSLEELRVSFGSTVTGSDLNAGETATVSYPVSLRSLVISGMFTSPPDIALQTAIRSVNAETWMGLPPGYWWYSGIRVAYSNSDNRYRVTITCTTKSEEDWSTYAATRNPTDGKFVSVPSTELATLRQQTYARGIRYQKYGLLKVGLFRMVNFHSLFGNITNRMP